MISAEYIETLEQVRSLEAEWTRLFSARPRQPSLSFEWSYAILRNHLAPNDKWFVVVLRNDRTLIGVSAMMTTRRKLLGTHVVTLQPIQELNRTHGGLLLDTGDPDAVGAWIGAIESAPTRWDVLRITRLLEEEPLLESITSSPRASGLRIRLRPEQPSYYLALPSDYPEYLAARSGKFRNHLKRAIKRLESRGTIALTRLTDRAHFERQFDELIEIERGSWKHEHGTAISAIAHQLGFYKELGQRSMTRGSLHLTFLRIDGKPVAYNLGLVSGGCYYYIKTSYLQDWRSDGVATIGRAMLIESLIDDGIAAFDFPGPPYEWERQWADVLRRHHSLLLVRRSLRGSLLWLGIAALRSIRPRRDDREISRPAKHAHGHTGSRGLTSTLPARSGQQSL